MNSEERRVIELRREQLAEEPYVYEAIVRRVVDGDSLILDTSLRHTEVVDLGFKVFTVVDCEQFLMDERFRLVGIDTPEPRGETKDAGDRATAHVEAVLKRCGNNVTIRTMKDEKGKYGRYMAAVWLDGEQVSLNKELLDLGLAKEFV